MTRKRGSSLLKHMAIFVAVVSIVTSFYLLKRSQFLSSKALTPSSLGSVSIKTNDSQNGLIKVDILFKSGKSVDETEAVSTIAFRLYAASKSGVKLTIADRDGKEVSGISFEGNALDMQNWLYPINKSEEKDQAVMIDFSAINKGKGGYSTSDLTEIAAFYIKGADGGDDINFSFDKEMSAMYSKRRPVTNIWQI